MLASSSFTWMQSRLRPFLVGPRDGDRHVSRAPLVAVVAGLAVFASGVAVAAFIVFRSDPLSVECERYASPVGDDRGAGTKLDPYRTAQRLVTSLAGGGTGCLLAGTYVGNVVFAAGGEEDRRLVLTRAPGAGDATLRGIVRIDDGANFVTVSRLRIDGVDPPTRDGVLVKIFGDDAVLSRNEIFAGGRRICVQTGDANGTFGIAWRPLIERNRIRDCGNRDLPALFRTYPAGHAIYLQADRHAVVRDNVIYDTNGGGILGGRGVQLWPDSQFATIEHNVVDNSNQWNVLVSGGEYPTGTTRGAKIRDNVLTNPVEHNVSSAWWGVAPTDGNEVTGNCVFGAPAGGFGFTTWKGRPSYLEEDNVEADPQYVDRASKDFRLAPGSPCEGKGPRGETGPRDE